MTRMQGRLSICKGPGRREVHVCIRVPYTEMGINAHPIDNLSYAASFHVMPGRSNLARYLTASRDDAASSSRASAPARAAAGPAATSRRPTRSWPTVCAGTSRAPLNYLLSLLLTCLVVCATAGEATRVRVAADHHGFVVGNAQPFVPIGVSWYRPGTGWAPQLWRQFDEAATRADFARLKAMGMNVVRVFITFGSFYSERDQLDPRGLMAFDRLLDLADEAGLRVHPTGPESWEGMPAWTHSLGDVFTDMANEECLAALENFWRLFASRYRGRATIWAYDLRNEPVVAWNTTQSRIKWDAWRRAHGKAPVGVPDPMAPAADGLLDYQHFRESLAEAWVARQAQAIHAVDAHALVSVGLLQWSVPAQRISATQYSAFRPALIAKRLDFMELHYYPLATGVYRYESPAAEDAHLAVLEAMARECAKPGLPLVIAEFGWYGGGPLDANGQPATEEQQARWCRRVIETTSPMACGWLNWGLHDHPQATDVSRFTGLLTVDGVEKAWGRTFATIARRFHDHPPVYAMPTRPDVPWDECVVSGDAAERFRSAYLAAFIAARAH